MPTPLPASRLCWLFYFAFVAVTFASPLVRSDDREVTPPTKITVESWIAELDLSDSAAYSIGGVSFESIFAIPGRPPGKLQRLDEIGLQTPVDQLVRDLEDKKFARIITAPKLRLSGTESGSFRDHVASINASAKVDEEKIRVEYSFQSRELMPNGTSQSRVFSLALDGLESGKPIALPVYELSAKTKQTLVLFMVVTVGQSEAINQSK